MSFVCQSIQDMITVSILYSMDSVDRYDVLHCLHRYSLSLHHISFHLWTTFRIVTNIHTSRSYHITLKLSPFHFFRLLSIFITYSLLQSNIFFHFHQRIAMFTWRSFRFNNYEIIIHSHKQKHSRIWCPIYWLFLRLLISSQCGNTEAQNTGQEQCEKIYWIHRQHPAARQ